MEIVRGLIERTIPAGDEQSHRLRLLDAIAAAGRTSCTDLETPNGYLEIDVLVNDCTTRNFGADSQLIILVASLSNRSVLQYVIQQIPGSILGDRAWSYAVRQVRERANGIIGRWRFDVLSPESAQLVLVDSNGEQTFGLLLMPWKLHPTRNRFVIP